MLVSHYASALYNLYYLYTMWDFRFITLHDYHIQYKLIAGYVSKCFSRISDLLQAAQQRLERRSRLNAELN